VNKEGGGGVVSATAVNIAGKTSVETINGLLTAE